MNCNKAGWGGKHLMMGLLYLKNQNTNLAPTALYCIFTCIALRQQLCAAQAGVLIYLPGCKGWFAGG